MGTPSYWVLDPDVPDLLVLELDAAGHYEQVAQVVGDEAFDALRTFTVRVVPADLLGRLRAAEGVDNSARAAESGAVSGTVPGTPERHVNLCLDRDTWQRPRLSTRRPRPGCETVRQRPLSTKERAVRIRLDFVPVL